MRCCVLLAAALGWFLFRDTLIKLILSSNLEYKELTAQQAEPAA
jgi:hypothetical protein